MKLKAAVRYAVIDRLLWRAPLWPSESSRPDDQESERCAELERAAFALGSALPDGKAGERARARYRKRARFRATPQSLWAGAGVGHAVKGKVTTLASGTPSAHLTVRFAELLRLGRSMLERPAVREQVRLALSPSLLVGAADLMWLPFGDHAEAEVAARVVPRDPLLEAVIEAAQAATSWGEARAAVARMLDTDDESADELLLRLIDDGLLVHDLSPPLVGPEPLSWMVARLEALAPPLPELDSLRALIELSATPFDSARLVTERTKLQATLLFDGICRIDRQPLEKAAALLPLLLALQEALTPPADERTLALAPWQALTEAHERFGAGRYDLAGLALGDYGVATESALTDGVTERAPQPPAPLLSWLTARLFDALAAGQDELELDPEMVASLSATRSLPPTAELFVMPAKDTAWLLGHHAPGGASLGRFAHALGDAGAELLQSLVSAELAAGVVTCDVAFAPTWATAELTAHPPARAVTLGLSSWGPTTRPLSDWTLQVDGAGSWQWMLDDGVASPSPLARVRSSTIDDGLHRLAVGWSLVRQHAPWSLAWPSAWFDAAVLPRVRLGEFVIAPRSFARPSLDSKKELAAWRAQHRVPRHVQVGLEDQLLHIDLDAEDALAELEGAPEGARIHEVWPPLDDLVDTDGRRVELVVPVVLTPGASSPVVLPEVPAPRARAVESWRTFKLYGAPSRADRLLADLRPLVATLEESGAIAPSGKGGWFFLRYREGARSHLRLRLRPTSSDVDLRDAVQTALADARAAGDLVTIDEVEYFAERGRYGDALPLVEQAFSLDSAWVLTTLDDPAEPALKLVTHWDAIAQGLGLDRSQRRACAAKLRATLPPTEAEEEELRNYYRAAQGELQSALQDRAATKEMIEALAALAIPPALLPDLLHLAANRRLGTDAAWEARAAYLWERALESSVRRR